MIVTYSNRTYRITYQSIALVENALGNPNLIQISLTTDCKIKVRPMSEYGIEAYPNGEFRSWQLTGINTKLNRKEQHFIYARLERASKDALLVFSVNDYNVDGTTGEGTTPSEYYYYIKLGKITATDAVEGATEMREVTLDYGKMGTDVDRIDNFFQLRTDANGNEYIITKYHVVSEQSYTSYATPQTQVPSLFDGIPIDNDTIYWEETDGVRILKAKGSGEGTINEETLWQILAKPGSQQISSTHISDALKDYIKKTDLDTTINELKKSFVTTDSTEQEIAGLKHFLAGLTIGESKKKIYEKNGVLYIDSDVALTGTLTTYATDGVSVSTIMDGVVVDGITISKEGGALKIIGGTGGSDLNSAKLWELMAAETSEQINKSHLTTALGDYLLSSEYTGKNILSKLIAVDGSNSGLDADYLDGYHASGLLTSMSSSRTTNLSVTVGGHTETLSTMHVDYAWRLENTRKIWGQNFNGTADVSGNMTGVGSITASDFVKATCFSGTNVRIECDNDGLLGNYQSEINNFNSTLHLQQHSPNNLILCVGGGNVGIGISSPSKKLVVNGDILIKGNILAEGGITQYSTGESGGDDSGTTIDVLLWGQRFTGTNNVSGEISGCSRIHNSGRAMYLGNAGNAEYVYAQDMASQKGTEYWLLKQTGEFKAKCLAGTNIRIECDQNVNIGTYTSEINNFVSNIYLQQHSSNNVIMCVGGGKVGIKTASPAFDFEVNGIAKIQGIYLERTNEINAYGGALHLNYRGGTSGTNGGTTGNVTICATGGYVGIGTSSPTERLHVSGNIYATGSVNEGSDQRAKNIIEQVELSIKDISNSPMIRFKWNNWKIKDDGRVHVGGIAQYIQQILPEVITKSDGMLTMDYGVTGYIFAVNTARHLQTYETRTDRKISRLEKRICILEKQLRNLGYNDAQIIES